MSSHMAGDDPAEARRQHGLVGEGRGRLLRQAGAARGYLAVTIGLGLAGTALILLQAGLLARLLAGAARGTPLAALAGALAWLGVVVAGRAVAAAGGEAAALRAAAAAGAPGRAFPRRGVRPADPEAVRPGQDAGGRDQGGRRRAPEGNHGDAQGGVLVGPGARAHRGGGDRAGRRGDRIAIAGGPRRLPDGAAGASAHA